MDLRHPDFAQIETLDAFVQAVVDEVYGETLSPPPVPIGTTDWSPAWIALVQNEIVGVALTVKEWVEDLWVSRDARGCGVGTALLLRCETEVRDRGFLSAKLRVVSSNHRAIHFYEWHGWSAQRSYPHENLPVMMTDFTKVLPRPQSVVQRSPVQQEQYNAR